MSTSLAARNTHNAPHARMPSWPVGGSPKSTKATKTRRSEPSPKRTVTGGGRRKDKPKADRINVVFEKHDVPKLVTEYSPTSSTGPFTPPTPPAGLTASIGSKHSRSSLRPPTDQHSSRTTIHRPRPRYAYSPDIKADPQTLNDKGRDTNDVKPDVELDVKPEIPSEERIRDLKGLEAYGVRFVQRTDDMRGTQVLALDADFATDVAYLSMVSKPQSTATAAWTL